MGRFLSALAALALSVASAQQSPAPAQPPAAKKADNYAGTVVEFNAEKVVVAKTKEQRTFRITPETKIEGKLKAKVRVTVRYTSEDDGYTAVRIIVRASILKPK